MAKKEARRYIYLECTKCNNKNYTTEKNILNNKDKMELKKFCQNCKQHTLHIETKK